MKRRIIGDHISGQFAIPLKEEQWVVELSDSKYAIMETKFLETSTHTLETIVQVFSAEAFRVEDCCNGTEDASCACK